MCRKGAFLPLFAIKIWYTQLLYVYLHRKTTTILICKSKNKKNMLKSIDNLNIRKNNLLSLPVLVELSKIEDIAKSEQLEEKVNDFKTRYDIIKDETLKNITDRINELDSFVDIRDKDGFYNSFSEIELDLYGVETSLDSILSEIKDIASYEEKYRAIVIKLKNKYRVLDKEYKEKENLYGDISKVINIQFENIKKRFKDFDKVMEEKLYNEVILVVKSIDTMVDHLAIVLNELPDIILLINDIIPLRIKDLQDEYEKLDKEGFPLLYLNIEGTINDVNKRCNDIYDKCKVLNITDSLFDLNNILSYIDNLFDVIEKEKTEKVEFELLNKEVSKKIASFENTMKATYDQLDDIKELYDLKEKDLDIIEDINLSLLVDIKEYKKIINMVKARKTAYSNINILMKDLSNKISNLEVNYQQAMKSIGNLYDDEQNAIEQVKNMKDIVSKCRKDIRNYHLPLILDNYFVEMEEAEEAIELVEKELEVKPIVIKSLNLRVGTARDLVLKVYQTTTDMLKYAYLTEQVFVYGNQYRDNEDVDRGLRKTENLYSKGEYKQAFELSLRVLNVVNKDFVKKIKETIS